MDGDGAVFYVLSVDMSLTCGDSLGMSLVHMAGAFIFLGDPSSMRLGIGGSEVRAACKQCFRLPFRHGSLGECTTQDDRSHGMWNEYVKCLERRCEGKHRKGLAL